MIKPEFSLKNKKILVTGGAGFIGSNLCEYLLSCESYVTCLDNFSTGYKHNINDFLNHCRFNLIEGDITDINICQKACKDQDFILHQAALGSVPRSIKDPITTNEVNVSGFLNMLTAARDQKIKRFIFATSSSTYGDSKKLPKIEDEIGKPLSPYAITKLVNELYAEIFQKAYGLDYIGLRYFNVFGRRQDPNGSYAAVIPLFVKQLINRKSPVINGDGSYSRDFTYIDNVIQMNILCLTTNNPKALNQIYNTAYGKSTTILELVNHIKKFLSKFDSEISKINISHGPNREGDIPFSIAGIDKAKENLKYNPIYSLEKGLKISLEWYWRNLV
jgi:UDP-N-acetylglucosamine 4-epimerase